MGHFLFVFFNPYPDGNGRLARFLMNMFLASASYPWTSTNGTKDPIFRSIGERFDPRRYSALRQFIREEMNVDWSKEPSARRKRLEMSHACTEEQLVNCHHRFRCVKAKDTPAAKAELVLAAIHERARLR